MFQFCLFVLLLIFSLFCMRSSLLADSLLYDLEIEKTAKQVRKEARIRRARTSGSVTLEPELSENIGVVEIDLETESEIAEDNNNNNARRFVPRTAPSLE